MKTLRFAALTVLLAFPMATKVAAVGPGDAPPCPNGAPVCGMSVSAGLIHQ